MALGQKIETFMGEVRMLVPALGALLGFQLTVPFQAAFKDAAPLARAIDFSGLCSTTMALVFLLVPPGYHRFTVRLDESARYLHFAQAMVGLAFVFLTLGLSCALYVQASVAFHQPGWAAVPSAAFLAAAASLWWWLPMRKARRLEQD